MDRNLRTLTFGAAARAFGLTFVGPFAGLYLLNVGHLGFVTIGLLVAAISIPPLLLAPIAGLMTDRIGRRRVLVWALFGEAGTTGGIALAIWSGSIPLFVVGFAAGAVVGTAGGPALSAYIADLTEGSERTRAYTWFRIGHNAGFALGVAAGGAIVTLGGFLLATEISGLVLLGAAGVLAAVLRPTPYDDALALRRGTPAGPDRKGPTPSESLRTLLGDRLFLTTAVAFGLSALVASQWNVTYALYGSHQLGLSYAVIGGGFALNGLLVVLGQNWTTNSLLGRKHTTIGIYGTVLYAIAFLALGAAPFLPIPVLVPFFLATAVLTFGENLVAIPTSTLPSNLAPRNEVGSYNGAFGTITGFGGVTAAVFGGAALAAFGNPLLLWTILVAPSLPAILLLRWVGTRLPSRPNRA
jgi:MFS family permease